MTIMDIGMLMAQFSGLPDSERENFVCEHPQIRNALIVDWALTAARVRAQMGEPEASTRYAQAALYIAIELGDRERQATAQGVLAKRAIKGSAKESSQASVAAGESSELEERAAALAVEHDRSAPVRPVPQRTKSLIASATELTERPSLRTMIRLMLRHSDLIPQVLKTAFGFVFALIRNPIEGRQRIDRAIEQAMDEASLTRARELAQRARLEGEQDTARHLEELPDRIGELNNQLSAAIDKALILGQGSDSSTLDAQTLALLRVSFAGSEEEAWVVVEGEPGLLSNAAIEQIRAQAAFQAINGNPVVAGRLWQVASWLSHWRSELADPAYNVIVQLSHLVDVGELTLDAALADLEKPGALTGLGAPHLGAVDERVMELRMQDLIRAETLAVLNDAAARRVGDAKARACMAISLAELRVSQGDARNALRLLEEALEQAR